MSKADQIEVLARMRARAVELGANPDVSKQVAKLKEEAPTSTRSDRLAAAFIELGMDERYMAEKAQVLMDTKAVVGYWEYDEEARKMVHVTRLVPDVKAIAKGIQIMVDAFGSKFEQDKTQEGAISVGDITIIQDFRRETREKSPNELAAEGGFEVDGMGNIVDEKRTSDTD